MPLKHSSNKNGKRSLLWRQVPIVAITFIAVTVAILLNRQTYRETREMAKEQFNHQQLILARSAAAGIETFITDVDDDLLALSNFPVVQRMEPGMLEPMEVLYMGVPPQTSSRRLDKNGILRFVYPNEGWRKDLIGRDYSGDGFFQKAKETGTVVISGLVINEAGDRRIQVLRPVYVEDDKGARTFNGVVIGSFDPDTMASLYISPIISGETGYAWLLNEEGILLAHHEEEFVGRDAFKVRAETNPELPYDAIDNIQRQMMTGEEEVSRYVSGWHRGQRGVIEKLVAYTPVHVSDHVWSVAVCAPVDEVERIASEARRGELYTLGFIVLTLTAAGVSFFVAFYRWTRSLQQEIEIRKQAEERIVHLNAVLRAIRGVNQLITRVKDREKLLQGACDNLIETRGYHSAWIALMEKDGRFITAAQSEVGKDFPAAIDRLKRGELTRCIRQAVEQSGVVVVADPAVECGDCPLVGTYAGKARTIDRLEYEGRVYGFLTVTVPVEMAADDEERSLFGEVAGDIAFALHTIEVEADRQRAEEALWVKDSAIASSINGIALADLEGSLTYVNPSFLELWGYDEDKEVLGKSAVEFCQPEEEAAEITEALRGGDSRISELAAKRKDGSLFDVQFSASMVTDGAGKPVCMMASFVDITERKRAEEERDRLLVQTQEQAQQVQQIMDTVPEGVILLDAAGQVILANPVAEGDLAVLADASVGDTLTRLGDRPLAELLTSPPKGLWHEVATDGRSFEVIARPLETGPTPGGACPEPAEGWVLVMRDVTREREIQRYSQQQERLATVGQLAAGIAHDFNNIMATIVLYAQMLSQTEDLSPRSRERLATVNQQALHATNLIQQILDFSRRAVLERRPLNLLPLLKEQIKLLERTLPENIDIVLAYGPDEYTVNADPTRMQQVVMNLALNARDAMPAGGDLRFGLERIQVQPGESPPLPEMKPGEWVQVMVSDTGTGIPPDVLPRIFDPFFTTKAPGEGSGKALGLVLGVIERTPSEGIGVVLWRKKHYIC